MFEYRTGPDYTLAFISLARRISAAHAYFESGEAEAAEHEIKQGMEVLHQLGCTALLVE